MHPWVGSGSADWFSPASPCGLIGPDSATVQRGERALAQGDWALPNFDWAVAMCYN